MSGAASGLAVAIGLSMALAGCGSGTIYKRGTLGDVQTLSIDARQRLAFAGNYTDASGFPHRAVCVEPSPDAAVARAAALAAGGSSPLAATGGAASLGQVAAALSASSSESVASIGLRTQTIQLLRDGYYRACEGLINGVVNQGDYSVILANVDATMIALAAVDALGVQGTTQAPGIAISAGGASGSAPLESASATPAGASVTTSAGTGVASPLAIQNTFPPSQPMTVAQSEAIRAIALTALANARERTFFFFKGPADPAPLPRVVRAK